MTHLCPCDSKLQRFAKLPIMSRDKLVQFVTYLSAEATKILVCSLVLSRIDYCNSLLAGAPKYLLDQLQRVQNNAARLIFKSPKHEHITPLLHSLHWLPVSERISYKVSTCCYNSVFGNGPQYLADLVSTYTPSRQLRSAADTRTFRIPYVKTKSFGQRAFQYQAPTFWNQLPHAIRHSPTIESFKASLKTHLFRN